jgi:hypothetical protein
LGVPLVPRVASSLLANHPTFHVGLKQAVQPLTQSKKRKAESEKQKAESEKQKAKSKKPTAAKSQKLNRQRANRQQATNPHLNPTQSSLQQPLPNFAPVVHSIIIVDVKIVRGGEQNFFSIEFFKVAWQVIDHVVSVNHCLASAEHKLLP